MLIRSSVPDTLLVHHQIFGEYGIPVRDGGQTYVLIRHCLFCGHDLGRSRRDDWFDATEAAGLDGVPTSRLPERWRTAGWRLTP